MLGTAAGPHPFPTIVREFQRMIGEETKAQILEKEGRLPDAVIACVGGGSNAIGMFADFIDETNVGLIGVEPAGHGIETVLFHFRRARFPIRRTAARFSQQHRTRQLCLYYR
ncbi:hypothetical protein GCM10011513_15840 [Franconibacter daqui]|nr:hypothetical protein GCM10011513_15840 [Franconibacter daqui]